MKLSSIFIVLLNLFVGTGATKNASKLFMKNAFGLTDPIYLWGTFGVKDGGSTQVILRGFEGKEFYILIDHSINTETDGRIYVGHDKSYPHDGEKLVPLNSVKEAQVLDMLQKVIDNNINQEMQAKILSWLAKNDLENLSFDDPRMDFLKKLPFEDLKTVYLLEIIQTYKNTFHH